MNLRGTLISDEGIKKYVSSENSCELKYLDMSNNSPKITDLSIIYITDSIYMQELRVIKSDENKISN